MIILPAKSVPRSLQRLATFVIETIETAGVRVPPGSRLWRMNKLLNSGAPTIEPTDPEFEIALESLRDLRLLGFVFDQCQSSLLTAQFRERLEKVVDDPALPQHN